MIKGFFKQVSAIECLGSLGRGIIGLAFLFVWLLSFEGNALAVDGLRSAHPDVFSREDITIEPGRMIGRLLVTGCNATVGGVVEKGIVVIDGNLFLTPEAHIKGTVLILGGYVQRESGAILEKPMVAVAPIQVPFAGLLVLGLLSLGLSSLVALPIVIWLTARIIRNTSPYLWIKERFLQLERHWSSIYIIIALATGVLLFTFFAEMAYETLIRRQMDVFDNVFIWLVRYLASPELDRVMIVISGFGYGYPFWTIILIVLLLLAFYRQWLESVVLLFSLLGEVLLNFFLKSLFERSRPDLFRVVEEAGYSFPSGHAMLSICFYGIIAFLISRHIQNWRWRLAVITLAVAVVAAIGLSRIYLGVHYPTDVVAGYFAGGMWFVFCIAILMWWERRQL